MEPSELQEGLLCNSHGSFLQVSETFLRRLHVCEFGGEIFVHDFLHEEPHLSAHALDVNVARVPKHIDEEGCLDNVFQLFVQHAPA